MTRRVNMAVCAAAMLCIATITLLPAQPAPVSPSSFSTTAPALSNNAPSALTDEQIAAAVTRGANFLLSNFDKNQLKNLDGLVTDADRVGLDALCIAAILQAGDATGDSHLSINDPLIKAAVEQLKRAKLDSNGDSFSPLTYAHAMRAVALSLQNRPEDHATLAADVNWLIHAQRNGAYGHSDTFIPTQTTPPQYGGVQPTRGFSPYPPPQQIIMNTPASYGTSSGGRFSTSYVDHCIPTRSAAVARPGVAVGVGGPAVGRRSSPGRSMTVNQTTPTPTHTNPAPTPPTPPAPQPSAPSNPAVTVPNNPAPRQMSSIELGFPQRYPGQSYPPPMYPTQPDTAPEPTEPVAEPWNNLDSAIGLLGVWYGAEAGIEVPIQYWQATQQHWLRHELPTGQWYSTSVNTTPSIGMTWAGDWALRVTQNWQNISQTTPGRQTDSSGLLQAMNWLQSADNSIALRDDQTDYVGYNLFMLNLVGQSSGYKYLGSHDWYHEIANTVIPVQWPNGAFGRTPDGCEAVLQTAYTMIFLSRGLHPVFMEKLHFSATWNNRPRDLANLSRFTSRELERSLNWEVMPTSHDWTDWLDSPVLYIASHESPALSPAEMDKLRAYYLAGGMLFTHADGGSPEFKQYIEQKLVPALFPNYKLQDIPANDPIYSIQFPLKAPLPKLRGVSNGSRWLLVDSPVDLSANWQTRNEKSARASYELATNLFVYASGKTEPRARLALTWLADANPAPQQSIKITRLSYSGNWDPEPYAWTRFDRWMQNNAGLKLQVDSAPLADLKPGVAKLAVLTGTADYSPTDKEIEAIKNFVTSGGNLLIDDCGGDGTFAHCIETNWLSRLSTDKPEPLTATDPILAGDASTPQYREGTLAHLGNSYHPMSLTIGKGQIIYCSIDLTTGLLGANTASILGYQPPSAMSFAKNVILTSAKAN